MTYELGMPPVSKGRGTTLGLNLFLVRLVSRAHGGDATASRQSQSSVEFRIGLGTRYEPIEPD